MNPQVHINVNKSLNKLEGCFSIQLNETNNYKRNGTIRKSQFHSTNHTNN